MAPVVVKSTVPPLPEVCDKAPKASVSPGTVFLMRLAPPAIVVPLKVWVMPPVLVSVREPPPSERALVESIEPFAVPPPGLSVPAVTVGVPG